MKFSTKGRYALRLMIDLATRQGDGYISLRDISTKQDISIKYLEQIVSGLVKGGLLVTSRGPQGGYRTARTPEEYTVGEILRVAEGGCGSIACIEDGDHLCASCDECASMKFWEGLQLVIEQYVDGVTLDSLIC